VPKLWTDTIAQHRRAVHDAALDTTEALVREHGLAAVKMSQIAAHAGIGRATLYKYFPDVEAILIAWHERQIARHLQHLAEMAEHADGPRKRLEAVLLAYALIQHRHHDSELAALLHNRAHVASARQQLHAFIAGLIGDGVKTGDIRRDIAPGDLSTYCLHALTAGAYMPSEAAVRRLVSVTMSGLSSSVVSP
jgi:AcrR family transcriptional regulator